MERRSFVKSSGIALAAALAGCVGGDDGTPTEGAADTQTATATATETATATATETAAETAEETATETSSSYSVSIEPVGEVTFESVPQTWVAGNGSWADMGIALGLDRPEALWLTNRYKTHYYDDVPGVSVDTEGMIDLYEDGVDKEKFYEIDADVHIFDPNFLKNRFDGWTDADVQEIEDSVGPIFGNTIFNRGYPWHEDYRYYTLYEAFEKLAQVFQREDRYEAFATLHEEFQSGLDDVVPDDESERPDVAILWGGAEPTAFYPYLIDEGSSYKHLRDLGVGDALAKTDVKNFFEDRGQIDYETLLEVDPEVLLLRGHGATTDEEFQETVVSFMEDHDTASTLTAVQNGDVYRYAPLYQGPIQNLVLTERLAQGLYGVEDDLYDHARVGEIVNGDI